MALLRRGKSKKGGGMSPFAAGLIGLVIIILVSFFGFTRYNPFASPYELKAAFHSANNIQPNSPVRIAGVNVGKVEDVKPLTGSQAKSGGAVVTMQIDPKGLPIYKDAELKIRPRIFLEGNFFVDVYPGTPGAGKMKSGQTIPVQQTATPVQFGQVLTALQQDTRTDLQTLLREYAQNGLGNGGAEAYNRSLNDAPGAFKNSAIANDATLGQKPHDLSNLERGQQRLAHSLNSNPAALQGLVTNLNITAAALAREDTSLQATIPALRDTLRAGTPALVSLNNALPSLRAFAREALPGVRSSGPTIDASMPFITQLRLLVRPQELRGLVHDLRPTIPALASLQHNSIPLFGETRATSACANKVVLPFSRAPIPDPDAPDSEINGQPFYKQAPRALVGLAGESRITDGNSPLFHINFGSGPTTLIYTHQGQNLFSAFPAPPEGTRPAKPSSHPQFRPDIPCETQQPPNLNAAGGPPDQSVTAPGSGLLPPLPGNPLSQALAKAGAVQVTEVKDYFAREAAGKPAVDPVSIPHFQYVREMAKLGLKVLPSGKSIAMPKGSGQ